MNALVGTQNIFDPTWVTKFSEIKSELKTGDLILVHGRYPFSWVVTFLQGSNWGHTAMVVLAKDIDPENKLGLPPLLLWEANTLIKDAAINRWGTVQTYKEGPMLVDLEERLYHTQNQFDNVTLAYKPLITEAILDFTGLPELFDEFIDKKFPGNSEIIYSVYLGRRYNRVSNQPENEISLDINFSTGDVRFLGFNNGLKMIESLSEVDIDKEKIYCSELVAYTYKKLGLLTQNHVSNAYAPKDFSNEGTIRLLDNAFLGQEMFFNMNL
ncbi:hypothetical protein [Pedobacter steynii]|uniref:Permuted papain-like amidase enzyme, YaeF/YiiX, C92 family n=1 Tax=Pedobacter steynii TaxID=430522 RepID=A0A1D7QLY1_9SPHI|nr:hypothetical protein [Pedobacter steynii]AOM79629.1 hypothetical protein BFS30_22200 [Pedobacter steynii]